MVMGLHHAGLRVIQDVVFNHTSGFGEASNSILDEVVPDYYNRLDADGALETGSCCADTATEHLMMGKLQQDAVLWNAKKYKIDGFRFDIMSFTFVKNLQAIQQALAQADRWKRTASTEARSTSTARASTSARRRTMRWA